MSLSRPLPLAISMGDPAGCGPAITCTAWQAISNDLSRPAYVVGPSKFYSALGQKTVCIERPQDAADVPNDTLAILEAGFEDMPDVQPGVPDEAAAPAIIKSIAIATTHAQSGLAAGLVTNPINKALLYKSGFTYPGHTEYIAHLCATPNLPAPLPVMMLVGGGLRVALATIHMPLVDVPSALTQDGLQQIAIAVHSAMLNDFRIPAPKLAFTGLNPHAGESGTIGTEEQTIINPAAEALRMRGINISDARPGDTVFAEALQGQFDAVIAMTHDQGLIPVKTLDFWGGVNVTLGLPIVRTSPDHGTAYDAAAAGTARADSLIAAIRLADAIATNRANANV